MAKTAMKVKQQRKQKFSTREYSRCRICGRPHAYLRKYGICSVCFREWHTKDRFPGLRKQAGRKGRRNKSNDNERSNCRYAYKNP